uniref:RNA-binding protein MEX3B-like n=1 Tax=Myxine glutinosa TaxID=7769 RepID=UPI00358F0F9B
MPSSLFADMEGNINPDALDDQRALQLALDQLSLLGLDQEDGGASFLAGEAGPDGGGCLYPGDSGGPDGSCLFPSEAPASAKRSVNMTECVPVPSSEHVAEIVGRQGCKIKALRAKTNTYIKTPVRGEEPVFVVTGRREDVALAKREILSAAEHFSLIRASRTKPGGVSAGSGVPPPPNLPGQTTIQVRVPYRVVGLVVGPKGATIKRIQQATHTYIVTPSRDKEPVFEVTGMPENVDRAREEIEAHIALRTGCGALELSEKNDFHSNGTDVGFDIGALGSLWIRPAGGSRKAAATFASYRHDSGSSHGSGSSSDSFFAGGKLSDFSPISPFPAAVPGGGGAGGGSTGGGGGGNGGGGFVFEPSAPGLSADDRDLGFESPGFEAAPGFDPAPAPPAVMWSQLGERSTLNGNNGGHVSVVNGPGTGFMASRRSYSLSAGSSNARLSPTLSDSGPASAEHPLARRARSDPMGIPGYGSGSASTSPGGSTGSAGGSSRPGSSRDCLLCLESEVIAALVPCGHNLFCMECAKRICQKAEPMCPVCKTAVTQAIRIYS